MAPLYPAKLAYVSPLMWSTRLHGPWTRAEVGHEAFFAIEDHCRLRLANVALSRVLRQHLLSRSVLEILDGEEHTQFEAQELCRLTVDYAGIKDLAA